MSRRFVRLVLVASFVAASAFAAWSWLRPYASETDSAARGEISETLVTRDRSFFWINVHYKVAPGMVHDLQQPVSLTTGDGKSIEPADTTFAGPDPKAATEIWFKFWLEPSDLARTLTLHLNGGSLVVKATTGIPDAGSSDSRNFTTNHW